MFTRSITVPFGPFTKLTARRSLSSVYKRRQRAGQALADVLNADFGLLDDLRRVALRLVESVELDGADLREEEPAGRVGVEVQPSRSACTERRARSPTRSCRRCRSGTSPLPHTTSRSAGARFGVVASVTNVAVRSRRMSPSMDSKRRADVEDELIAFHLVREVDGLALRLVLVVHVADAGVEQAVARDDRSRRRRSVRFTSRARFWKSARYAVVTLKSFASASA